MPFIRNLHIYTSIVLPCCVLLCPNVIVAKINYVDDNYLIVTAAAAEMD